MAAPDTPLPATGRLRRLRVSLSPAEWGRIGVMGAVILLMHLLGWGIFVFAIMPRQFHYSGLGIGLGVAVTAYTLGLRHAFDADHISAIDNVTRKLIADGKRPLASGFFFALGHSTIVFAVGIGISIAARALFSAVVDPDSTFETIGGVIGTAVSGGFLYLIAILNIVVLAGIIRVFREMRKGTFDEAELEKPAPVARPDVPVLRPVHAVDQQILADVLRRHGLRYRLRHRDRGPAARGHRRRRDRRVCRGTRCSPYHCCSPPA